MTGIVGNGAVALQMRPDLVVREQHSETEHAWVVKDPVSLRYFRFTRQEFSILQSLDGSRTPEDIRLEYERAFPPHRITRLEIQSFLASLNENRLLLLDGADQSQLLLESHDRLKRQERWSTWTNWLAIRFSGFDPDWLLTRLYPKMAWCFSPWCLAFALLSIAAALSLIFVNVDELQYQLPALREIISPANLVWLTIAFVGVKVFHEFGHALTCKHFGGECHEMGVLLLLFAPCLYCNVTDSWMLQSRWQRIGISIAGILVELQVAALATFLWLYSQPGVVHTMALNLVVVCSVGTVVFNGNPLLRYDGYFVLADLVGIPNLWQESRATLKSWLAKLFLRRPPAAPPAADRQAFLTIYGLASIAYRAFVLVMILLLLHRVLVPQGLGFIVPLLMLSLFAAAAPVWVRSVSRFWRNPTAWRQVRRGRVGLVLGIAIVVVCGFLAVPLPCRISAPAMLMPHDVQHVYVSTPGSLVRAQQVGARVTAGDAVAQLDDPELRLDVVRLAGALNVAQMRVRSLEARMIDEPEAAPQLEVAKERLIDIQQQLEQRRFDEQGLSLKASVDGTVMEPPASPMSEPSNQNLPFWTGTPLESKNAQCFLQRGTLLCLLGNPSDLEAIAFVDENDVQFVRVGQPVLMQFSMAPSAAVTGRIVEIVNRDLQAVPSELALEQDLLSQPDASGLRRPLHTTYSVRVELDPHQERLLIGARGTAKITVDRQTLAQRALRILRRTFKASLY